MATNTIWQQSEVVRQKMFPQWYEMKFNVLSDFFEKGEVEKIGERNYRVPVETKPGGRAGTYDPQMGDMGRGSSPSGIAMIQSFFNVRLSYEFDQLQIKATENRKVAIQNPFLKCVAGGFKEMQLYWDKWIHGNGTAALATAVAHSSGSGVSVYTMDSLFGTQRLRIGQFIGVYDSTLATLKTVGVLQIAQMNTRARTITLTGIVPGAAATDIITFEGVSGASPAGPRGLQYWISNATSGTTASINRANESQIISKSVNANSQPYVVEHVMAAYHQVQMDRGEVADNLMGLVAPAQVAAVFSNVVAIQNIHLESTVSESVERLPKLKGRKSFMWGNVPHMPDIHQDATRADYIASDLFGKAVLADTDFFSTAGVQGPSGRFFPLYAGSGAPASGVWFALTMDRDIYCIDPGAQAYVYNLPLPTLYQ